MVDIQSYVETGGGSVRVLWASLVSSLTGVLAWANIQGYISLIDSTWGGIASTLSNVGTWGQNVVTGLITIPYDGIFLAYHQNAVWVQQFGPFSQIVAALEIVLLVLIIYWTVTTAIGVLT